MALWHLCFSLGICLGFAAKNPDFPPCLAVRSGNLARLRHDLELESVLRQLNLRVCMGVWVRGTLLHEAADKGDLSITKLLVSKGALVDVVDGAGFTPFVTAVIGGHFTIAEFLRENRADVDHPTLKGQTALMIASQEGSVKACDWLLTRGVSLNKKDVDGNTALMLAAREGHEDIVQVLLQKGLNVEDADRNGWTSLVWALKGGHLSTARKLIDYGASAQHRDVQGNSPLLWPLKQGNLTMVQLLLDHGAEPYRLTADGLPVFMASGSAEINDYMLRSRWIAFFTNPWAILCFWGGCVLGVALAYGQLEFYGKISIPYLRGAYLYAMVSGQDLSASPDSLQISNQSRTLRSPPGSPRGAKQPRPQEAPEDLTEAELWPQFFHGAFLAAAESSKRGFYGEILNLEATAVMFSFGAVVVRWIVWLPLLALFFLWPSLRHWTPLQLLKEPARLVAKVRLPGLLLLLRVSILWCLLLLAARPARCEFSSYATWANYLCAVEGSDSSPFVQLLTDPQWPQLLMKQMVWRRSGVSSLTGCYFLMLALGFVGYLVSLVEGNLSQSPLLSDVTRALRAGHALGDSRTASTVSTAGSFRKQLQIQVGLVAVDTALHVNTVFVLLWTGCFGPAFVLTLVLARSISLQFLLGRLTKLPEAIRESLRYGLFRKDLLELLAEQRGFQGFLALCITAYSYWFCVEVAFHGYALLLSLVLSTCNVAEHLQQINCHIDLEEVPAPPEPTVPVASPAA